jgi:hypothetical protein
VARNGEKSLQKENVDASSKAVDRQGKKVMEK